MTTPVNQLPAASIAPVLPNETPSTIEATAKKVKPRCEYHEIRDGKIKRCRFTLISAVEVHQCKCGKVFCNIHKSPLKHQCSYNHQKNFKAVLIKKLNPKGKTFRVNKHENSGDGSAY